MVDNSKLKNMLKDMLKWFHDLCIENNLTYYVAAGTMLGAARHQGFIPWDDDVDVLMPRSDIKKLEEIMSNNSGRYVFESTATQALDFYYTFPKIYDTTTTLVENTKYKIKRGIYIDIFPIDGMGNTYDEAAKHLKAIRRKYNLLLCKIGGFRKGRSLYKNMAVALFRLLPINEKKLLKQVVELCENINCNECKLSGNALGAYGMKEIMPLSVMGTPKLYKFEDIEVFGAENAEEYLTRLYGDWCKLPPVEKQVPHHDYVSLDLDKSYLG